jgi:hypothetical protein
MNHALHQVLSTVSSELDFTAHIDNVEWVFYHEKTKYFSAVSGSLLNRPEFADLSWSYGTEKLIGE